MTAIDRLEIAAQLIGEKARAVMLWHLLGDSALTATELATCANVSPQSASMHLNKLSQAGLVVMEKQGRHRYHRLASPEVAAAVEALAGLVPGEIIHASGTSGELRKGDEIRYCRTCYDHLAGEVGVLITEQLLKKKIITLVGREFSLGRKGDVWFKSIGVDTVAARNSRRALARACLDWSERRFHLAGALGAVLLERMIADDWIRRKRYSRAVIVTPKGQQRFFDLLQLSLYDS